jgi:hypothetical protein
LQGPEFKPHYCQKKEEEEEEEGKRKESLGTSFIAMLKSLKDIGQHDGVTA